MDQQALSSNFIGEEVADPPLFFNSDAACTNGCRYSDASFYLYYDSVTYEVGLIARTQGPGSGYLDSSHNNFLINPPPPGFLVVGDSVNLMGKKSGWLEGVVVATCQDQGGWNKGSTLLCQTVTDYGSDSGDSGGPVFTWDGASDYVDIRGIHAGIWAADTTKRIFSPWTYVDMELNAQVGTITVEWLA